MSKDEKKFIKFTALQRRLLSEINRRQRAELTSVLEEIGKELDVDLDDDSIQYVLNKNLTGFDVVRTSPKEQKENKTNGKENGHSTEGEVSVENPVHGDKGDV